MTEGLDAPFTTSAGLEAGLPRRVLDSDRFVRPTRGVRSSSPLVALSDRARGLRPVLRPDAAFSHVTAARMHGLPLSYAIEQDDRVHFIVPISAPRVRRPGSVCHRVLHERSIVEVDGLRVVGLADTWVDLGELVGRGKPVGLDDLIVVGDAVASWLGTAQPLAQAVAKRVRPRGKRILLEALDEVRVGSRSARETLTRLLLTRCGLPEPKLNQAVVSARGQLLGVADLSWDEHRVAGEYQGEEHHSSEERRLEDASRAAGFRRDGWLVEEVWKADLSSTSARRDCVLRFAAALHCDESSLDLTQCEPRFFSRHALDLALQRDEWWRHRRPW